MSFGSQDDDFQPLTGTLRSNTKNLLQIPHTDLKRFGDRAFCAYAPRLWNELPDNIKAADSVQETAENIAISKRVYLTIWTIIIINNNWNLYSAFSIHKMFKSAAHCHSLSNSPQRLNGRA